MFLVFVSFLLNSVRPQLLPATRRSWVNWVDVRPCEQSLESKGAKRVEVRVGTRCQQQVHAQVLVSEPWCFHMSLLFVLLNRSVFGLNGRPGPEPLWSLSSVMAGFVCP